MSLDQLVEVEIERIVPGGRGLGHAAGLTLFVALAAPGDLVRAQIDEVRGRVGYASIIEVVRPGPSRGTPPCRYFGACGGCDWQHLTYESQLAAKREILADCLQRIGGVAPPDLSIVPSPQQWDYRSRAVWRLDPPRQLLGYYEHASHRICEVETCPVLTPRLRDELARTRQRLGQLHTRTLRVAAVDEAFASEPPLAGSARELSCVVRGERYRFDAACFFQTNLAILDVLVEHVLRSTPDDEAHEETTGLDLYCGVGLFTVPLARRFSRVVGVETSQRAVKYARRNLAEAGLGNARVVAADVGRWLAAHRATTPAPNFVILDPPRTGLEANGLRELITWRPRRITYVSCDPATLARDLRQFIAAGYTLESLVGFDMFPQTHHVEAVAHLALGLN